MENALIYYMTKNDDGMKNQQNSPNDQNLVTEDIKQIYDDLKISIESGKTIASCIDESDVHYMRLLNVYVKKDGEEDGSCMQVCYLNNDEEDKNKGEWLVVRFRVEKDKWRSYATPLENSMMDVAEILHSIMTSETNTSDYEWDWRIINMLSGEATCRALVPKDVIEKMIEQ